jgi:CRP-like cAMP-binding protein
MQAVVRKLGLFAILSQEEESALALLLSQTFALRAGQDLVHQDEHQPTLFFLLEGFACRHKQLPDGRRQILSFLLPGDGCDLGVTMLPRRDHTTTALSTCRFARTSDPALEHLAQQYPRIRAALQWATLTEEAIAREWVVNVGRRNALERTAHVFCEIYHRMAAIGLVNGTTCELPLTQTELGDTLGLSTVHVNRTLQELRSRQLIAFGDKRLTILDLPRLEGTALFDPSYLQLDARYGERLKA